MQKKRPSKIMLALHETASGLHQAGHMEDKTTAEFDLQCLPSMSGNVEHKDDVWSISADDIAGTVSGKSLPEARRNFEKAFESHTRTRVAIRRRKRVR